MSRVDDWVLAKHQKLFDELEYRYGITTAQAAEGVFLAMWLLYGVKHTVEADGIGWMIYVLVMSGLTIWICRREDRKIRADRKTDAMIVLITRKMTFFVFLRVTFFWITVFFVLANFLVFKSWTDLLNTAGIVLNLMGIYFFACINDIDGTKRRAKEYEEAEKRMEMEHVRW